MALIIRLVYIIFLATLYYPISILALGNNKIDSLTRELQKPELGYKQESNILNLLSYECHKNEKYSEAIRYKKRELNLYKSPEDDSLIANGDERLGVMYYYIGSYDIASQYFIKALKYCENNEQPRMMAQITGNLANIYTRLENHKKALDYLYISKSILSKKEFYNKKSLAGLYTNIGLAYAGIGDLDSAMYYYKEAISLIPEGTNPLYAASIKNNIGEVDYELGNYQEAIKNYNESYLLFSNIGNYNGMGSAQSNLAKVKIKTGNYSEAIQLCNSALENFEKIHSLFFIVDTQKQLSEAYEGLGDYKSSKKHLELYLHYNDSLQGNETMEHIASLEMQHVIFKEEQKFKMLKQEALLIEKEHKLKQVRLYMTIGGVIVLLIITVLIIINLRGSLLRNNLKQLMLKQQQDQLKNDLSFKQKEIESFANHIQEKNKFLDDLKNQMKLAVNNSNGNIGNVKQLTQVINHNLYLDNDRKELELKIDQVHQEFIHRIKTKFPSLTKTDIRLCSLLLLNLSSKDIGAVMNIESASVKTSRNRLRKKMALPAQADIAKFLSEI